METVKSMLRDQSDDINSPRKAFDWRLMKATEMEGEKRGRIELGEEEEAEGFDGGTGTSDEHKTGNHNQR